MNTLKKYKFKVEDLECANCALEVENHLNSIDGINNCHVNFTKLTMNLETDYEGNVKQYIEKLSKEANEAIEKSRILLRENIDLKKLLEDKDIDISENLSSNSILYEKDTDGDINE